MRTTGTVKAEYAGKDIVNFDPVDTPYIIAGLERTPHFRDTLAWWTGTWIQGPEIKFYRPLTSLVWWGEYQVFGRYGLLGFSVVHALSHLLVLGCVLLFLKELLGLKIASLSVCLFALSTPLFLFDLPAATYALHHWKDNPDIWCSALYLLALWCFTKFLRVERRGWMLGAIACFLTAIFFKEMAYTLPLLLLLLLWHEKKLLSDWRWVVPFYIVATVMFIFRFWALGGMGFRFGTNGSWFQRWFMNVIGGAPAAEMTRGQLWPFVIACTLAALLWGITGKTRRGQIGLLSAAGCGVVWNAWQARHFNDPFYYQLMGSSLPWINALHTFAVMFLIYRFVVNRKRGQIFGWLWVVITYLPLMTAPITQHALYFVSLGWSIWLAYALVDLWSLVSAGITAQIKTSKPEILTAS